MNRLLQKLTMTTAALFCLGGVAMADSINVVVTEPGENFAAKPGCGLYNACYRVEPQVQPYGVTVHREGNYETRDPGLAEALGTAGYRYGYDTFNVIDSIR